MARSKVTTHSYQFNKGLVTDASPLAFPENTCSDIKNVVLGTDGSISCRKALALESTYHSDAAIYDQLSGDQAQGVSWCRWNRALPGIDMFVIKIGNILYFRSISSEGVFTSTTITKSLELTAIAGQSISTVSSNPVSFAPTAGYLVVVGSAIQPQYIKLDPGTYDPSATKYEIYERDFEGFDDGLDPSERPALLTPEHLYNLYNRGWDKPKIDAMVNFGYGYPSNSDLVNFGYYDNPSTGQEAWTPGKVVLNSAGASLSTEGSIIFNTFSAEELDVTTIGQSKSYVADVVADPTDGRLGFQVFSTALSAGMEINALVGTLTYWKDDGLGGHTVESLVVDAEGPFTVSSVDTTGTLYVWTTYFITDYVDNAGADSVTWAPVTGEVYFLEYQSGSSGNSLERSAEDARFEQCAVFAGRIWYAGVESERISNRIYFSQVFEGPLKFGYCYQEADPTNRNISELIATDGGVIVMNEMGKCLALVPYQNNLLAFTTNGVWSIFGRDGIFDATQFGVRKISEEVLVSPRAVALSAGGVVYWSSSSVSVAAEDPAAGTVVSKSLSDGVLKNFVTGYTYDDWKYISACSDDASRTVLFLLPDGKVLLLDFRLGAFYTYDGLEIANTAVPLTFVYQHEAPVVERLKLLSGTRTDVGEPYAIAFHSFTNDTTYIDYEDSVASTTPIDAYAITGCTTAGDASRIKQAPYVTTYMETNTDSSCYMSAQWDFSSSALSGKFTNTQQCYVHDTNYSVASRKLRVRGSGAALQLKFANEAGKPFKLLGWDVELESTASV